MRDTFKVGGHFPVVCRVRKRGKMKVAWNDRAKNGITLQGLDFMLNKALAARTDAEATYIGVIDNGSFSEVSEDDEMDSHAGWIEFDDYKLTISGNTTNRTTWTPGVSASNKLITGTALDITITADGVIRGLFITNRVTKGIHASPDTLWATGLFAAPRRVAKNAVITIGYACSAENG